VCGRQITDHYAFALLNGIICHVPPAKFPEFLPVLTSAALERSVNFIAPFVCWQRGAASITAGVGVQVSETATSEQRQVPAVPDCVLQPAHGQARPRHAPRPARARAGAGRSAALARASTLSLSLNDSRHPQAFPLPRTKPCLLRKYPGNTLVGACASCTFIISSADPTDPPR
jgi:hypothetical protein